MPNENNVVMRMHAKPEPMSIAEARKCGFCDFTFYSTAREATEAAAQRATETGRKTITFTETVFYGKWEYPLHVMGETERPKPVVTNVTVENRAPRHCPKLNAFAWFMGEWAAKIKKAAVSR